MLWVKTPMPDLKEAYTTTTGEHVFLANICGDFRCPSISGEEMRHLEIAKFTMSQFLKNEPLARKGIEPDYAEKIKILRSIGRWKKVALEVMPTEAELIDRENLYHMWEFENLSSFFINAQLIFTPPKRFYGKFEDLYYEVTQQKDIMYIFFQSDGKVPWRKKQALKNYVAGVHREGVEIITKDMLGVGYGAMIILPYNLCLSFGLE